MAPHVAVVGGGYAGIAAVRALLQSSDPAPRISLIDPRLGHELLTRLPEIVHGRLERSRAIVPYRELFGKRVDHVRARVISVDPTTMRAETDLGSIRPDWLVLAAGSVPGFMGVPGVAEHATLMKSVENAVTLRDRLASLEGRPRRVLIVGAGYTGTELAGELASLRRERNAEIHIVVAADADRLLPQGNARMADVARGVLLSKGVELCLGNEVRTVKQGGAILSNGRVIESDVIVWAAQTEASPLGKAGWTLGSLGRIVTDSYLHALGRHNTFVAGDIAHVVDPATGVPLASSAQLAIQEGRSAGLNVIRGIRGDPPREFRPRVIGEALTLGDNDGVAEVAGLLVTGQRALAVKRAALFRYLVSLGGVRFLLAYGS